MLQSITTQNFKNPLHSRSAYEVRHFMDNFFEAIENGNQEEVATYYSDETQPFQIPYDVKRKDEALFVEDHLATFNCLLHGYGRSALKLSLVLDKSEGYWQIIHGEIKPQEISSHQII